jgi:hypothetical protein
MLHTDQYLKLSTMTVQPTRTFTFFQNKAEVKPEPIKWVIGNTRYEVYVPSISSFDTEDILPHGQALRTKVLAAVGTAAHRGPSLFEVYSRSLSPVLSSMWEGGLKNAEEDELVHNTKTIENFDARFKDLIQVHSTTDERYELAQFLRGCRKPRDLPVQSFWYKLREINTYIEWLPGEEPALNEQQLKQAFHDAMPPTWRERFANAGNSLNGMTMAQVAQYFRGHESQATRKMLENNQQQHKQSLSRRREKKGSPKTTNSRPKDKDNNGKTFTRDKCNCIDNNDPCPIHPGMGHTWGKCRSNVFNEERMTKRPKKGDNKVDSMAVTVDKVYIITNSLADLPAINDAYGDIGTYSVECYVNVAAIIADHHMNTISFSADSHPFTYESLLVLCNEDQPLSYMYGDASETLRFKGRSCPHTTPVESWGRM